MKTYIIAEAGVNHNGDIKIEHKLIEEAKKAGADCVKFQTFKAENLVTKNAPKAKYQLKVTDNEESQFDMLKSLELNYNDYKELIEHCKKLNIDFMSTPYSFEDVDSYYHPAVFPNTPPHIKKGCELFSATAHSIQYLSGNTSNPSIKNAAEVKDEERP